MVNYDDSQPGTAQLPDAKISVKRQPGQSRLKVICSTCRKPGAFTPKGPNSAPAWLCVDYPICPSYVGCEKGTENALGSPAGPELRAARVKAHGWIDSLWRGSAAVASRTDVYQVLSQAMGLRKFHVARADLVCLERLDQRRPDIERAFGRIPKLKQFTGDLGNQIDQALLEALFGEDTRRLWPTDHGGQVAARRCLHVGTISSTVDAAGRRWITKQKIDTEGCGQLR